MAQTDSATSKPFRVIIIGAGIVGLSLSHALQLANIDHVVLEKHDKIVSVRGAALIIWPTVARIFDQYGILDKITKTITPVGQEYIRWPDGSLSWHDPTLQYMSNLYVGLVLMRYLRTRVKDEMLTLRKLSSTEYLV